MNTIQIIFTEGPGVGEANTLKAAAYRDKEETPFWNYEQSVELPTPQGTRSAPRRRADMEAHALEGLVSFIKAQP